MRQHRTLPFLVTSLVLLLLGLPACDGQSPGSSSPPNRFSLTVQVEDPSGAPIEDARVGVRPCFRLETGLDCGGAFRSSGVSEPSTEKRARTAPQRPSTRETIINPPYPNPFHGQLILEVAVANPSVFRSTLRTLDGTVVDTAANTSLEADAHRFLFRTKDLPSGLYEQHSQVRVDGEVALRDTHSVVLFRSHLPLEPGRILGKTDADGTLSTTDRAQFPSLYSPPPITARDNAGVTTDTLRVATTVQFVVQQNLNADEQVFPRVVTEDTDTVTLTLP